MERLTCIINCTDLTFSSKCLCQHHRHILCYTVSSVADHSHQKECPQHKAHPLWHDSVLLSVFAIDFLEVMEVVQEVHLQLYL